MPLSARPVIQLKNCPLANSKPIKMQWDEAISTPFRITLDIVTTAQFHPPSILYHPLSGKVIIGSVTRDFDGIITAIEQVGLPSEGHYRFTIEPLLALLGLNNQFSIYKNRTIINIIEDKLKQHQIPCQFKIKKMGQPLKLMTQYNESDLNFIQRLVAQSGLSYFFKHTESNHTLVFTDHLTPPSPIPTIALPSQNKSNTHLLSFEETLQIINDQHLFADYQYLNPNHNHLKKMPATVTSSPHKTSHYHFTAANQTGLIQNKAHDRPNQFKGISNALAFCPMAVFKVDSQSSPLVITSISHHITDHAHLYALHNNEGQAYNNHFTALAFQQNMNLPSSDFTQPNLLGVQTATVEAAELKVNAAEYGEVMLRFPWAVNQTYPARYYSLHASGQYGHQFIPRHQQQVVVQFIDGDPNQGVVTGALFSEDHLNPFTQIPNQPINGIRSHVINAADSTGHEFVFDDSPGKQQLKISSAGDMLYDINHNALIHCYQNHTEKVTQGNKSIHIKNGVMTIKAKTIQLQSGASEIKINASGIHLNGVNINFSRQAGAAHSYGLARKGDDHHCGKYEDLILPHQGGPILEGSPDVFINQKPAARQGDAMHCDHSKDAIASGVEHILINDKPAARKNSKSSHDGHITAASDNVTTSS